MICKNDSNWSVLLMFPLRGVISSNAQRGLQSLYEKKEIFDRLIWDEKKLTKFQIMLLQQVSRACSKGTGGYKCWLLEPTSRTELENNCDKRKLWTNIKLISKISWYFVCIDQKQKLIVKRVLKHDKTYTTHLNRLPWLWSKGQITDIQTAAWHKIMRNWWN